MSKIRIFVYMFVWRDFNENKYNAVEENKKSLHNVPCCDRIFRVKI